jgi:hypothetical protein
VPATANSISDLEALLGRGDGNDVSNDFVSGNSLGKERGAVGQFIVRRDGIGGRERGRERERQTHRKDGHLGFESNVVRVANTAGENLFGTKRGEGRSAYHPRRGEGRKG